MHMGLSRKASNTPSGGGNSGAFAAELAVPARRTSEDGEIVQVGGVEVVDWGNGAVGVDINGEREFALSKGAIPKLIVALGVVVDEKAS